MMADDWISMRCGLHGNRHVLSIARHLAAAQLYGDDLQFNITVAIGALQRFWSWAQAETVDGWIEGVDAESISSIVGVPGFGEALKKTKWVVCKADGIQIPRFEKHMGNGSKKRLLEARRAANYRQSSRSRHASVTQDRDEVVTGALPTEQKKDRTEEKKKRIQIHQIDADFAEWWKFYPKKVGKDDAIKKYKDAWKDVGRKVLLEAVSQYAAAVAKWPKSERKYRLNPATWLHQGHWSDDPAEWERKESDVGRKIRA